MWPSTRVTELLSVRYPIVQAPMAGFTTPELVAAVSNAGGLGSLAGAFLGPDALQADIAAVRNLTDRPFNVNLFAPLPPPHAEPPAVEALETVLAPYRAQLGLSEPSSPPSPPLPGLVEAQLAVVVEERVPVFSFTFGAPPLDALRETGCTILGTATNVAEAVELERLGVDIVVAQSAEAGGHRGSFLGSFERSLIGGMALLPQIVDNVSVPVVLAGGIMDGRGIAAALALGAEGAQLGTAFMRCSEAGTLPAYRKALAEAGDQATAVTAAYSGRPARAIRSALIEDLEASGLEPLPYPIQSSLLAEIRTAGVEQGRGDLLLLLAGQATALGRELPAGELVEQLARETEETLRRLS